MSPPFVVAHLVKILYYMGALERVKERAGCAEQMQIWNFKLDSDEFGKIQQILASLAEKTRVESVFLINRNGQEIAREGNTDSIDTLALSSLAASNLAATFGLASLVGEGEFERVYLRGRDFSILICPAGQHALLLFVIQAANEHKLDVRNLKQASLVLEHVLQKCTNRVEVVDGV